MFVCKLVCSTYKCVVLLTYSFPFLWFLIETPTAQPSSWKSENRSFAFSLAFRQDEHVQEGSAGRLGNAQFRPAGAFVLIK